MLAALAIGALGHLLGSDARATPRRSGTSPRPNVATLVLANVIGLLIGFTLGVVLRSSPTAIVAFFVWSLVLPNALYVLGTVQEGFADVQPWIDFYYATSAALRRRPHRRAVGAARHLGRCCGWCCRWPSGCWRVHRAEVK